MEAIRSASGRRFPALRNTKMSNSDQRRRCLRIWRTLQTRRPFVFREPRPRRMVVRRQVPIRDVGLRPAQAACASTFFWMPLPECMYNDANCPHKASRNSSDCGCFALASIGSDSASDGSDPTCGGDESGAAPRSGAAWMRSQSSVLAPFFALCGPLLGGTGTGRGTKPPQRETCCKRGLGNVPQLCLLPTRAPGRNSSVMQAPGSVHGGQFHATRTRNLCDRVLPPALEPASQALLRSQGGPHAGAWLSAVQSEAYSRHLSPLQLVLRCRLRLPLPF